MKCAIYKKDKENLHLVSINQIKEKDLLQPLQGKLKLLIE